MINRIIITSFLISMVLCTKAQSVNELIEEAKHLEKQMKEAEALEKDKDILKISANDLNVLNQASQLSARIGNRQKSKDDKIAYYNQAKNYAQQALQVDPNSADANLSMAIVMGRMTLIAGAKDKVATSKEVKKYAELAIKFNPSLGQAYYVLGKWNSEVANLNVFERGAAKMLFGGIPDGSLEKAIMNYEKCRQLDPGFILNYYELAKVYKQNNQQDKAIEILKKVLTLRNIAQDDANIKMDCKKMLEDFQ